MNATCRTSPPWTAQAALQWNKINKNTGAQQAARVNGARVSRLRQRVDGADKRTE
jgi:hypothetical protein